MPRSGFECGRSSAVESSRVESSRGSRAVFCAVTARSVSTCRRRCTVDLSDVAASCVGVTAVLDVPKQALFLLSLSHMTVAKALFPE